MENLLKPFSKGASRKETRTEIAIAEDAYPEALRQTENPLDGVTTRPAAGAGRKNEEVMKMGKDLLREFVEQGWLDRSVAEGVFERRVSGLETPKNFLEPSQNPPKRFWDKPQLQERGHLIFGPSRFLVGSTGGQLREV